MTKKTKSKTRPKLQPVRPMRGPSQASLACDYKEAAERVALGWQPMGRLRDSVILVADAEALAAWQARAIDERKEEINHGAEAFEQAPPED